MGYSGYLDAESKNILLEYQNSIVEKEESFLDLFYELLEEQTLLEQSTDSSNIFTGNPFGFKKGQDEQGTYYGVPKGALGELGLKAVETATTPPDNWWSLNPLDWLRWVGTGIAIFEPFGVLSYPQFLRAWQEYDNVINQPNVDSITKSFFIGAFIIAAINAIPNIGLLFGGVPGLAKIGLNLGTRSGMKKVGPKIIDTIVDILTVMRKNPEFKKKVFTEFDRYIINIKNPKPFREGLETIKKLVDDEKLFQNVTKLKESLKSTSKGTFKELEKGYTKAQQDSGKLRKGLQAATTKAKQYTVPAIAAGQTTAQAYTRGGARLGTSVVGTPTPKEDVLQSGWDIINR